MRSTRILLAIDAVINLLLGILLVFFPRPVAVALGVPIPDSAFYPSILGAVLFGIGMALALEWFRPEAGLGGLGLAGAIAINLCGGLVLAVWLLFGSLDIPPRGYIFLWALTILLITISGAEVFVRRPNKQRD